MDFFAGAFLATFFAGAFLAAFLATAFFATFFAGAFLATFFAGAFLAGGFLSRLLHYLFSWHAAHLMRFCPRNQLCHAWFRLRMQDLAGNVR